jgi:hypothetical protein
MYNSIFNLLKINKKEPSTTAQQIHNKIIIVGNKNYKTNVCCEIVGYIND